MVLTICCHTRATTPSLVERLRLALSLNRRRSIAWALFAHHRAPSRPPPPRALLHAAAEGTSARLCVSLLSLSAVLSTSSSMPTGHDHRSIYTHTSSPQHTHFLSARAPNKGRPPMPLAYDCARCSATGVCSSLLLHSAPVSYARFFSVLHFCPCALFASSHTRPYPPRCRRRRRTPSALHFCALAPTRPSKCTLTPSVDPIAPPCPCLLLLDPIRQDGRAPRAHTHSP